MDPVDLLVFGPHPDDIEIGLGGTVAKHAARGVRVGLCDLTAGEMGSNGTVEERLAEAEAAREVLGAAWRVNLRWPDRAHRQRSGASRAARWSSMRAARPRAVAIPYWSDRHPDHVAASRMLTEAVFNSGLRRYDAAGDAWRPEWVCYYFINDSAPPSFVVDVSEHYETKRRALACHRSQFTAAAAGAVATRLTSADVQSADREPRRAVRRPRRRPFAEGFVVREPVVRDTLFRTSLQRTRSVDLIASRTLNLEPMNPELVKPMNIGILCYASIGGSGIVATELGKALADRGHEVHFISSRSAVPARPSSIPGCRFTRSRRPAIRCSASRSTCCRSPTASCRWRASISSAIVHAHYADSACDRRAAGPAGARVERLGAGARGDHDAARHGHHPGRERSVVLRDRRLLDRAIRRRHGGVEQPARRPRDASSACSTRSRVIPNFIDCALYRRAPMPGLRTALHGSDGRRSS